MTGYQERRAERALRRVAAILYRAARRLTYRGGERGPRFLLERAADYLVFVAIFRAWNRTPR